MWCVCFFILVHYTFLLGTPQRSTRKDMIRVTPSFCNILKITLGIKPTIPVSTIYSWAGGSQLRILLIIMEDELLGFSLHNFIQILFTSLTSLQCNVQQDDRIAGHCCLYL